MRIKGIKLRNIRSYREAEIGFPEEGSILLSGNIGSGKSSVLLAVDFALFGLQRGELSGAALLRNGADSGEVELALSIDDKEVIIRRALKRSSSGISQDSGSISVDGDVKQATAVELKQDVLSLLNYPNELLSKSKSLIFRYTVYTPQEEMKQILLGDSEVRLNTLRRVFDIDKYKRIVENSKILSTHLRERKKELSGRTADLPVRQQELTKKESEVLKLNDEKDLLQPQLDGLAQSLQGKESEIKLLEGSMAKAREHKLAFNQCDFELKQFLQQRLRVEQDMSGLEAEVASFTAQEIPDVEALKVQIGELDSSIVGHENRSREFSNSLQAARTKVALAQSLISQISQLNECPTCRQEVALDYKKSIVARENAGMASLNQEITTINQEMEKHSNELALMKQRRESLVKSSNEAELVRLRMQSFNEKRLKLEDLKRQNLELAEKVNVLTIRKEELSKLMTDDLEPMLQSIKSEHQVLLVKEKELLTKKASVDTSIRSTMESIESLRAEIEAKKKLEGRMHFLSGLRKWVNDSFVSTVESMERSVMMRVHGEFNSLFSRWFGMLVGGEEFSVRLDETFTPIIEQDGYDIEYQYLSGGEKTAAALAYRLALNQVTNDVVNTIKTKDLLILDEPTDGFSAEQLDHMKGVLEQLNMGQIIIVSHEEKIASMVDKVIRFSKENHSTVVS